MNIENQQACKPEKTDNHAKFIFRKNKVKNIGNAENYVRKKIIKRKSKQD